MVRPLGYEYSYGFSTDDEIIPLYQIPLRLESEDGLKSFLFEIRTNFKVKRAVDGKVMMLGSESFGAVIVEDEKESDLHDYFSSRLQDYWMSDDEIQSFARDAFAFAKQQSAVEVEAAARDVIAVVVELNVRTVQRGEGELIDDTIDRAIEPRCLLPLDLCIVVLKDSYEEEVHTVLHDGFLSELPRVRVEDDAGLGMMEVCPVCSRKSTIGAQISSLPCGHACHSLCLLRWLCKGNFDCPSCDVLIPTELLGRNLELA